MKRPFSIILLVLFFAGWYAVRPVNRIFAATSPAVHFWGVQSVDTMKYSRDLARTELTDESFDAVIDRQMSAIAATGATHVAIDTPYDEEFLPYLERWVAAARKYKLNVWYRGNWSGWEGWFDYPKISRGEHLVKTENFILKNDILFQDGDIFTACPECENGGPGDPRYTGDVKGFRQFMEDEYWVTKNDFQKLGKKVASNYDSMNGDVARLVMDPATTRAMDGIVTIDHYVVRPEQLAADAAALAASSGGKIVVGEFGAPIPDIHGNMTSEQQAAWLQKTLDNLAKTPDVVGVNYWTSFGGTTELWDDGGMAKPAVATLKSFYTPTVVTGYVTDSLSKPVPAATIATPYRGTISSGEGFFEVPVPAAVSAPTLRIEATGFASQELTVRNPGEDQYVTLNRQQRGFFLRLWDALQGFFQRLFGKK